MNIRKPADYSALYVTLDELVAADLLQMELYCEIGRLVSGRPEKGAAVAAAELTVRERTWYIRAVRKFGWSKLELQRQIAAAAHKENALDFEDELCYTEDNSGSMWCAKDDKSVFRLPREYMLTVPFSPYIWAFRQPENFRSSICSSKTMIEVDTM